MSKSDVNIKQTETIDRSAIYFSMIQQLNIFGKNEPTSEKMR